MWEWLQCFKNPTKLVWRKLQDSVTERQFLADRKSTANTSAQARTGLKWSARTEVCTTTGSAAAQKADGNHGKRKLTQHVGFKYQVSLIKHQIYYAITRTWIAILYVCIYLVYTITCYVAVLMSYVCKYLNESLKTIQPGLNENQL